LVAKEAMPPSLASAAGEEGEGEGKGEGLVDGGAKGAGNGEGRGGEGEGDVKEYVEAKPEVWWVDVGTISEGDLVGEESVLWHEVWGVGFWVGGPVSAVGLLGVTYTHTHTRTHSITHIHRLGHSH
jgi:hypothetical protein